eukprot:TRINITY_DN65963_c0_g1_i1.p3 TRINITY_DN65963_c0_g1~~TRINITY_DN65963_c0_g1_i1.p3  ORF type:complete len:116 (+),score=35.33 TRINITY_DN65963_c0_g1_i1:341-688(+)
MGCEALQSLRRRERVFAAAKAMAAERKRLASGEVALDAAPTVIFVEDMTEPKPRSCLAGCQSISPSSSVLVPDDDSCEMSMNACKRLMSLTSLSSHESAKSVTFSSQVRICYFEC